MMKVLPNGVHVLQEDTYLSKWIGESGSLIHHPDVALQHNLGCIHAGDVVVDGGAALGDHTAGYLERVGPKGDVYAFEPNPNYYHCLVRNCPTALFYDRALWHENTWLWMDIPESGNIGAGHIAQTGKLRVEAITLDFLALDRCNFIKLDVEGAELQALRGAEKTIRRCRPIIQCEVNPPLLTMMGYSEGELQQWLEKRGYVVSYFGTPSEVGAHELIAHPINQA